MQNSDFQAELAAERVPEIIFLHWPEVLSRAGLAYPKRSGYEKAILAYLEYCRHNGLSVTVASARGFMADQERRGLCSEPALWKEGLNWYFSEGRKQCAPLPEGVPSLGHADVGQTEWERRLIERLRLGHYSCRGHVGVRTNYFHCL